MPLYEYLCKKCGHRFEEIKKFSDKQPKKCPECGGVIEQVISAPSVQFKGSGWYVTDYAKKPNVPSSDGGNRDSKKEDKSKSEGSSKDGSGKESSSAESSSKDSSSKESSSKESSSKDSSSRDSSPKESTNRVSSSRKPDKRK